MESKICVDCKAPFTIEEGERKFFEARGFELPRRCPECRKVRKAQRALRI